MEIVKEKNQDVCNVTLSGEFTFSDHLGFRTVLQRIEDKDISRIVLHMGKVHFVDSAALGMLLLALDESEKHRKQLVISGATGQVKKMFALSRFNTLFKMDD